MAERNMRHNKMQQLSVLVIYILWLKYKGEFIVCCNAAAVPIYRLLIYRSSTQRTAPQVHFLAVPQRSIVGAETEIRPLLLTATQLQWTMNAA